MSQVDGGGARFVVTPVRRREHGAPPVPRPRQAHPVPVPVYWRLLSRNNRQLGRSPSTFRDAAEALAAAERVAASRIDMDPLLVRLVEPVRWLWTVSLDGVPAAVSGRSYERERVAVHALEQFLSVAAEAVGASMPRASTEGRARPAERSEHAEVTARRSVPRLGSR